MANEFGNKGAISLSRVRLSTKQTEMVMRGGEAEYEAYYGGYWRDISSDYMEDVTKDGNTITRCIRWDGDFRSYRNDRGLIIRRKGEDDEPSNTPSTGEDILDHLKIAGKAFVYSAAVSLGARAVGSAFKLSKSRTQLLTHAAVVGGAMGSELFDKEKSTSEKIKGAITSGLTMYGFAKVPAHLRFTILPAYILSTSQENGASITESIAEALGGSLGLKFGGGLFNVAKDSVFKPKPPKPPSLGQQRLLGYNENGVPNFIKEGITSMTPPERAYLNTGVENVRAARSLTTASPRVTGKSLSKTGKSKFSTDPMLASQEKSLKELAKLLTKQKKDRYGNL
jgi:hypothetical protein